MLYLINNVAVTTLYFFCLFTNFCLLPSALCLLSHPQLIKLLRNISTNQHPATSNKQPPFYLATISFLERDCPVAREMEYV